MSMVENIVMRLYIMWPYHLKI